MDFVPLPVSGGTFFRPKQYVGFAAVVFDNPRDFREVPKYNPSQGNETRSTADVYAFETVKDIKEDAPHAELSGEGISLSGYPAINNKLRSLPPGSATVGVVGTFKTTAGNDAWCLNACDPDVLAEVVAWGNRRELARQEAIDDAPDF